MATEIATLDTNVLVYAVDNAEEPRHAQAVAIIGEMTRTRCYLTLQSLAEFFFTVTRKNKMSADDAKAIMSDWRLLFPIICAQPSSLDRAINAVGRHQLAFWDAMLWATAKEAGVNRIYSEDYQSGREIDGVLIVNPFA